MNIKNCRKCGQIYNYVVGPNLCPKCAKELEDKFHEVKQYIYDNPGVNVHQVSEELDVPVSQIKHWVREERLQFVEGSVTGIECESCGANITSGRYCPKCKESMVKNLESAYMSNSSHVEKEDNSGKAKMRFLK